MRLEKLRARLQREWPAIARAEKQAEAKLMGLRDQLQEAATESARVDSEDISLVVFGSLARLEWTTGSDLDWCLLIDGQADHAHAATLQHAQQLLRNFQRPGPTQTFGKLVFSHALLHEIGGADDTNRNTTQRILLLLESKPIGRREVHDRVVRGILRRYLENDFRAYRLKVPRFLINDIHRFWRTMCVDYASKYRERAGKGWAIRNVKLQMSRKLIFVAGLIMCFSCDPERFDQGKKRPDSSIDVESAVDFLVQVTRVTPLELVANALLDHPRRESCAALFDAYDDFLCRIDDPATRDYLETLLPEDAHDDTRFNEIQEQCRRFEAALEEIFFDEGSDLSRLTRRYGVF